MARRAEPDESRRLVTEPRAAWVAEEHARVVRELGLRSGSPGNEALRSYLGSPLPVAGVRARDLRKVSAAAARRLKVRSLPDARALVRSLWKGEFFEERLVAIELLGRPPLVSDELAWRIGVRWVDAARGWALSDSLASGPIAKQVAARPSRFAALLEWTASPNPWRRRASTYALRPWFRAGALDRPFELLGRLVDDPERWVQRAVGTWLRECWKIDRVRTERFLRREVRRLAPVTITVATERAPKRFRGELRRANRRAVARGRGY